MRSLRFVWRAFFSRRLAPVAQADASKRAAREGAATETKPDEEQILAKVQRQAKAKQQREAREAASAARAAAAAAAAAGEGSVFGCALLCRIVAISNGKNRVDPQMYIIDRRVRW